MMEDTPRLILFTLVWTAVWILPLPRLGRWVELVAGLIPFAAFGLRVFAGFFVGVPDEDRVRAAVSPVLNWINGRAGGPPYSWVLDATISLGLVWLASAFDIPRQSRVATAWIIPTVAALSWWSLWATGLQFERFLSARVPAPLLAVAAGSAIEAVLYWTPSPLGIGLRQRIGWRNRVVARTCAVFAAGAATPLRVLQHQQIDLVGGTHPILIGHSQA
ncbi:MAG: hypothetical protein HQ464_09320, partial [Planctomycetes bacterium]|nr:hypothetical protein [Planctomycetota bacterium]